MKKSLAWPTEIYSFKNEIIDNDKIKELILQKEDGSAGISGSRRPFGGAWQSTRSILEENEFSFSPDLYKMWITCTTCSTTNTLDITIRR